MYHDQEDDVKAGRGYDEYIVIRATVYRSRQMEF